MHPNPTFALDYDAKIRSGLSITRLEIKLKRYPETNFYSFGDRAEIKIALDSYTGPSGQKTPEFITKYKAEICNREHTEANGVVLSPNYPNLYPNSMDCLIKLAMPDAFLKISLFFASFQLESSANCISDQSSNAVFFLN